MIVAFYIFARKWVARTRRRRTDRRTALFRSTALCERSCKNLIELCRRIASKTCIHQTANSWVYAL